MTRSLLIASLLLFACGCGSDGPRSARVGPEAVKAATPAAVDTTDIVARRVIADGTADGLSAVTPDGGRMVYSDWGTGDLVVRDLATGEVRNLTKNEAPYLPGFAMAPAIDPAGAAAAYTWSPADRPFEVELRLQPLDVGAATVVYGAAELAWVEATDWSPDGRWILALDARLDDVSRIVLIPRDGGAARVVKALDWRGTMRMKFSPDGRYIAVELPAADSTSNRDIKVLDLEGRREVLLVGHPADDALMGWSPDGRYLLFTSDRAGAPGVWRLPVEGGRAAGEPVLVKPDFWRASAIDVTRDGRVFYAVETGSRNVYAARLDASGGRIDGPPAPLGPPPVQGIVNGPAWSPDGERLAYRLHRPPFGRIGLNSVLVRSLATGQLRELPLGADLYPRAVRWAADGQTVLLLAQDRRGVPGLYRGDVQTGRFQPVLRHFGDDVFAYEFELLPGDRSAVVRTLVRQPTGAGERRIIVRDLAGDGERVAYSTDRNLSGLALAPSGTAVAVLRGRQDREAVDLLVVPLDGGEPRVVLEAVPVAPTLQWSRDGRWILFARLDRPGTADTQATVWRVPSAGGEAERLGLSFDRVVHLRLNPAGDRLAFVGGATSSEIWVLENLLPESARGDTAGTVTRRVLAHTWIDWTSAPSPDGDALAVTDWPTGDIALFDLRTQELRRLTENRAPYDPGFGMFPHFSPDGRYVAYGWWDDAVPFEWRLEVIDVESGERRRIYDVEPTPFIEPMDWYPDGRSILAWRGLEDGTNQLLRVATDGGDAAILRAFDWREPRLAELSPDGRVLAYDFPPDEESASRDVYLLSLAEGREHRIEHPADDRLLGWAPDGRHLLFASDRGGTPGAWLVPVADGRPAGEPVLVKPDFWRAHPVGFTRDGRFFYGVEVGDQNAYVVNLDPELERAVGVPAPVVASPSGRVENPAWSPDGRYLVYRLRTAPAGAPFRLGIRSLGTGEARELPLPPEIVYPKRIVWHPDGQSLLFAAADRTNYDGIYRLEVQTGRTERLHRVPNDRGINQLDIAPDGSFLVYWGARRMDDGSAKHELHVLELDGQRERLRLRSDFQFRNLALSRDGRSVVFTQPKEEGRGELMVLSLAGDREPRVVVPDVDSRASADWTPDGRHLVLATHDPDPNAPEGEYMFELHLLPLEGGEPRALGLSMPYMHRIRLSPDGRRVAFEGGRPRTEIWVMEKFLPAGVAAAGDPQAESR